MSIIEVSHLTKTFRVQHVSERTLQQGVVNFLRRKSHYEDFTVLSDVTFAVQEGEFFGIIGPNGSGKSTLMKLIAGIYKPSSGIVSTPSNIVSLFGVGVGFHPQLTARDNTYLNGIILGMSRAQIAQRMDDIVSFAGLDKFMDTKLAHFSSGMRVRLGFALAIQVDTPVLLLDEVFSVGDQSFRNKCLREIERFQSEGRTVVMVTHGLNRVRNFCSRAMYLRDGKVQIVGRPTDVIARYKEDYE